MNKSSNWSSKGLSRSTFYKLAQSRIHLLKINCGFHRIRDNIDVINNSILNIIEDNNIVTSLSVPCDIIPNVLQIKTLLFNKNHYYREWN